MNKKKKILMFIFSGFLILAMVFVVFFVFCNKNESSEKNNSYVVLVECIYKDKAAKTVKDGDDMLSDDLDIRYIFNLYIILNDIFEKEGLFNEFNKRTFIDQHISPETRLIQLEERTGFLIKGEDNLKKFKNIIKEKDFRDVDITKDKFKKAYDEIMFFIKEFEKDLLENERFINKILNLGGKEQVNFAKQYYEWTIKKMYEEDCVGSVYDKDVELEKIYSKNNVKKLEKQNALTKEQIDELKSTKLDVKESLNFLQSDVMKKITKYVNYDNIKDLHHNIISTKTVEDLKYEDIDELED